MCCRVLRPYIDNVFILFEQNVAFANDTSIRLELYARDIIFCHFITHAQRIDFFAVIVVLAKWMTYPIITQIKASHIRMVYKTNAEVVEYFTFI